MLKIWETGKVINMFFLNFIKKLNFRFLYFYNYVERLNLNYYKFRTYHKNIIKPLNVVDLKIQKPVLKCPKPERG